MANICLNFSLHIRKRLRSFRIRDLGNQVPYFDNQVLKKEVQDLVNQGFSLFETHIQALASNEKEQAVCGLMLSGGAWEILGIYPMEAWAQLQKSITEGKISLIAEPFYHSLNFLIDRERFQEEIDISQVQIEKLQGKPATSFFHTDLLYNDFLGYWANRQGYQVLFAPYVPEAFGGRDRYQLFHPPHTPQVGIVIPDYPLATYIESDQYEERELYARLEQLCQNHGLITLHLDLSKLLRSPHRLKKVFSCFLKLQQNGLAHFVSPEALREGEKTGGVLSVPAFRSIHEKEDTLPWLENPLQQEAWLALNSTPNVHRHHPFLQDSYYFFRMNKQAGGNQYLQAYQQYRSILTDINLKYSNKSS